MLWAWHMVKGSSNGSSNVGSRGDLAVVNIIGFF
jgi:hypothetical protein